MNEIDIRNDLIRVISERDKLLEQNEGLVDMLLFYKEENINLKDKITALREAINAKDRALKAMLVAHQKGKVVYNTTAVCMIAMDAKMLAEEALNQKGE